ncbi:hypothetical protein ABIE91_008710 [Bradyrhizobium elkanii]
MLPWIIRTSASNCAMKLLQCRQKLRRVGWDVAEAERLRGEMERLVQMLRELDE